MHSIANFVHLWWLEDSSAVMGDRAIQFIYCNLYLQENPQTSNCIGVFGLSLYTQERDLREAFSRYGPLEEVNVVHDHQTGRSRGFAFLYYRNLDDAVEVCTDLVVLQDYMSSCIHFRCSLICEEYRNGLPLNIAGVVFVKLKKNIDLKFILYFMLNQNIFEKKLLEIFNWEVI